MKEAGKKKHCSGLKFVQKCWKWVDRVQSFQKLEYKWLNIQFIKSERKKKKQQKSTKVKKNDKAKLFWLIQVLCVFCKMYKLDIILFLNHFMKSKKYKISCICILIWILYPRKSASVLKMAVLSEFSWYILCLWMGIFISRIPSIRSIASSAVLSTIYLVSLCTRSHLSAFFLWQEKQWSCFCANLAWVSWRFTVQKYVMNFRMKCILHACQRNRTQFLPSVHKSDMLHTRLTSNRSFNWLVGFAWKICCYVPAINCTLFEPWICLKRLCGQLSEICCRRHYETTQMVDVGEVMV